MTPRDVDTVLGLVLDQDLGCGCYCVACQTGLHGACRYPACSVRTNGLGLVDAWPKACGCGRSYTEHEWNLLTYVGTMVDDAESCELRNCRCGSTIAQAIETNDLAHASTLPPSKGTL